MAEARRNHCSAIVGKFLFVIGGIGSYGKYLNDITALNLESLKWYSFVLIIIKDYSNH